MKPVVYFDFEEYKYDNDKIIITKDRLKEILNEVYQAGYTDGDKTITRTPWVSCDDTVLCK